MNNTEYLQNLVVTSPAGIALIDATTLTVELVNENFLEATGKTKDEVQGQPIWKSFAEAAAVFQPKMAGVISSGVAVSENEVEIMLIRYGKEEQTVINYVYMPLKDKKGKVKKVVVWILENTSKIKKHQTELQQLNEELVKSQENLLQVNDELEERVFTRTQALATSERKFSSLIAQAPVAINLFETRDMIVTLANDKMLEIWRKTPADLNRPYREILPELEGQPLLQILDEVFATGLPYYGYENKATLVRNGVKAEEYFNLIYQPIRDDGGTVTGIMQVVSDVTDQVTSKIKTQELNEELAAVNEELIVSNEDLLNTHEHIREALSKIEYSEHRFRTLIEEAPVASCLFTGRDMVVEIANKTILGYWGKGIDILGKPLIEAIPELEGQPFLQILDDVYTTGVTYEATDTAANLVVDGVLQTYYFDFTYKALRDAHGEIFGVMDTAVDVTQKVLAQRKIEKSEANLRNIILQAPVAMCIFREPTHIVEIANDRMMALWGKTREDVIGKPIFEGLPEVKDQGFEALLDNVYNTGETFKASEQPVTLPRKNGIELVYVDFVYEAFREGDGHVSGIMAVATDVTEQVLARKKIEETEERARLAIASAELGTFDVDLLTGDMVNSPRMSEMYGLLPSESRDTFISVIHPDYATTRAEAYERALETGILAYEAKIVHPDSTEHWVKVNGKVYYDKDRRPGRILGIVQDITENKKDEQRKNDFISIVSHELKTPLTSLKANIQVLQMLSGKNENPYMQTGLDRADRQVNKMNVLINGFLNVSRLESGKIHIDLQRFNMAELVEEIKEEIQATVTSHAIIFAPVEETFVNADREKIGQVINNFISNATKYSPAESTIKVACITANKNAIISVQDEGLGIKPEDAERIFDRFYRVASNQTKTISGFGIGLYLSAEIIHRHHGKISVETEPGKGSIFYFSIPTMD